MQQTVDPYHSCKISPCGVPSKCPEKSSLGNRALLESLDSEIETALTVIVKLN